MTDPIGCKRAAGDDLAPVKVPKTDVQGDASEGLRLVFMWFLNGEGMVAYNWPLSQLPAVYAVPLAARIKSGKWNNPILRLDCDETRQRKKQEREMREYDPQFDIKGFVSALHAMKYTHKDGEVVGSESTLGFNANVHVIVVEGY
jgi:hypothetical protein